MRPIRLVAEGFTAFRDRTEIDFTDADFFALVGPTGSGKSSVLDALCFALYGSVPRYDDDRLVAPAITQGANEARVSLAFHVGGEEYVATRVMRRTKTGATTKEARLERGNEILAGDARGMNSAVVELIGLPFDHFTQCVMLPQGEFAQFLHDKPSERQDLLVRLLDLGVYNRMRQAAGALGKQGENAILVDEQRLGELSACTPEAETDARAAASLLKRLRAQLQEGDDQIRSIEQEAQSARQQAETAHTVVRLLQAVRVPAPVRTLDKERTDAVVERDKATEQRVAAEEALQLHTNAIQQLPDVAPLQRQVDAYAKLDEIAPSLATLRAEQSNARAAVEVAHGSLAKATRERQDAESEYDSAVVQSAATELVSKLTVGQPCPVCEQTVTTMPTLRVSETSRALKTRDSARKQEAADRDEVQRLDARVSEVSSKIGALEAQQAKLQDTVADTSSAAVLEERIAQVRAAHTHQQQLQLAFRHATTAERDARDKVDALDRNLSEARTQCEQQRDPLVAAGLAVPGFGRDLVASWIEFETWAHDAIPTHTNQASDLAALAEQHAALAHQAVEQLVKASQEAGVVVPEKPAPTVRILRERAAAAEQQAKADVDRIAAGIKESAKITKRIATTREKVEVAHELARLLRSDRFEQWIVNEALRLLVEGASVTLEQLSSGQYALSVDDRNEFEVIDHRNADERRSVMTLSGGETFQASLALALALADHVGNLAVSGAAKLDAIFLDEGFGTLDADSLDTVAATLETLGHDGRMVGIVTHVRDLAERVPVRYEVVKGPRTSTVTRVTA